MSTHPATGGPLVVRLTRRLPASSFAFVMATGILSTAVRLAGWRVASAVLLTVAAASAVILTVGIIVRILSSRSDVIVETRDPRRAFGFFTLVAGTNVISVGLVAAGFREAALVLAAMGLLAWLFLAYGIPAALVLGPHEEPMALSLDGSWFLWVVATQSVATAGAVLSGPGRAGRFAGVSLALWGIGVILYIILATLVLLRLLMVRPTPDTLVPSYWILMGATAISVFAGSRILTVPGPLPLLQTSRGVVSGVSFALWAFGSWTIPLLVVFGVWRHLVHRVPLHYGTDLWSIVFPIGMYAVASMDFGAVENLTAVITIGRVATVVAAVSWTGVTIGALVAIVRWLRARRSRGRPA